jgi:tetratricopeptide (TPR) repeat protein
MRFGCATGRAGILTALALLALNAQQQSTGLAGSVVEAWEIAVPEAKLTLTNSQTGAELTWITTQSGEYSFPKAAPGRYDLSVHAEGFKAYSRHNIEIKIETPDKGAPRLDVRLEREKPEVLVLKDLVAQVAGKRDDYRAHFNLGRAYTANGDLENAIRQFQESLKLQPDYRAAKLGEAQVAMRGGVPASALQVALELINANPGDSAATLMATSAYLRLRQPEDAANLLDALLKSAPYDTDALEESGTINLQLKRYKEAETSFQRAYSLNPADIRGLRGMSEVQFAQQKPEKSIQIIASEVTKYPQRAELRRELGAAEVRGGENDKAIADYQAVLEKYQDSPKEQADLYYDLGKAYQGKGDLAHATESLKKAAQLSQDKASYQGALASVYDAAGKTKEALEAYRQALKLDPQNAYIMNNAAYFIAKSGGDLDDALRLVQVARRQLPNVDEVLDTMGWVYLKMNLVDSSCQVFQDLVEKTGTNATFRYHYALALTQKGDKAAALEQLNEALKNKPGKDEEAQIRELIKKLS